LSLTHTSSNYQAVILAKNTIPASILDEFAIPHKQIMCYLEKEAA